MLLSPEGNHAGSLWDLHTAAVGAKGFRRSCLELDAYLKNILRVFDAEGADALRCALMAFACFRIWLAYCLHQALES